MGCFWSSQSSHERCMRCGRKGVNNLIITDHLCEICISQATRLEALRATTAKTETFYQPSTNSQVNSLGSGPYYGEYKCSCGRWWTSNRSWPGEWQICDGATCRRQVYAHTQRELRNSDWADGKNAEKHKTGLCQKCQQLGRDCKSFGNKAKGAKTTKFSTHKKSWSGSRISRTSKSAQTKTYRSWTKANRKL